MKKKRIANKKPLDKKTRLYYDALKEFNKLDLYYREIPYNYQLQIDTINYWTTSQKWYNTYTKEKGMGFNNLKMYLKKNYYIA